ncbi:MAG: hypothetical protein JSW70_04685 [Syntrophobacterales bacterium]|nr:MAG: hypothetical protein JSW70_04685 [Syntrophobacterales bacterium]
MLKAKRTIVATLSGVLFGFICYGLASCGPVELAWPVSVQIVLSRTLIGLAIGISCWRMHHWSIHGLIMGAIFSLPLAFSGLMAPESPEYSKSFMFISTIILGMVYGLLIEVITSILFKARM